MLLQVEQQKPALFTMQDGYRSNAYLNISVRDNARITCEALKNMPPQELTKLWKVGFNSLPVFCPVDCQQYRDVACKHSTARVRLVYILACKLPQDPFDMANDGITTLAHKM